MQIIDRMLADVSKTRRRLIEILKDGACASVFLGLFSAAAATNIAELFVPFFILMATLLPIFLKAFRFLRKTRKQLDRDRESLQAGTTDPRDYYEEKEKELLRNGNAEFLDSLSDRTWELSPEETEMLAKFSDEEPGRSNSPLRLLIS